MSQPLYPPRPRIAGSHDDVTPVMTSFLPYYESSRNADSSVTGLSLADSTVGGRDLPAGTTFIPSSSVAEHPPVRARKERVDYLSGGLRRGGGGGGGIRKLEKEYISLDNAINIWRIDRSINNIIRISCSHSRDAHTRYEQQCKLFQVSTHIYNYLIDNSI